MLAEAGSHEQGGADTQAMTTLKVIRDGEVTRTVSLDRLCLSIGRATDNDLCLPDTGVSRHHAQIITVNGETIVEDLGSRNGTFVNQQWVRTRQLRHGDSILIGHFRLLFCESAPAQSRTVSELLRTWTRGFDQRDYDTCMAIARRESEDGHAHP